MKKTILGLWVMASLISGAQASESTESPSSSVTQIESSVYKDSYSRKYGLTLGAVFPTGSVLEFTYRPVPRFSLSLSGGGINLPINKDGSTYRDTTLGVMAFEAKAKWHPWGRSFYLGLGGGWQRMSLYAPITRKGEFGAVARVFLVPQLGWNWIMNSGFTVGTEFGVQLALTSTISQNGRTFDGFNQLKADSMRPIPYVNIIKLGYSF